MYDYLFLDLDAAGDTAPRLERLHRVRSQLAARLSAAGGEVVGVFIPQLGWRASEAAVLIGWPGDSPARAAVLARLRDDPLLAAASHDGMAATARPLSLRKAEPGGIYVHRWFVVRRDATDEFVSLSTEAWRDFEARFDADIYGLFLAEPTAADMRDDVRRMLLLTRYRDHGEWERSRDPTTDAMELFRRRGALTRDAWGASTLLLPDVEG